jgi:hypothetical protein
MTVEDLMIGNWVKVSKGNWSQNKQINLIDMGKIAKGIYLVEPIPITTDILEKNGFIGEGDKFKMWTSADKRVILHNNDEYINTFNKWHVHVDTEDMRSIGSIELTDVHQLQQFLRLCGMNDMADNFEV